MRRRNDRTVVWPSTCKGMRYSRQWGQRVLLMSINNMARVFKDILGYPALSKGQTCRRCDRNLVPDRCWPRTHRRANRNALARVDTMTPTDTQQSTRDVFYWPLDIHNCKSVFWGTHTSSIHWKKLHPAGWVFFWAHVKKQRPRLGDSMRFNQVSVQNTARFPSKTLHGNGSHPNVWWMAWKYG